MGMAASQVRFLSLQNRKNTIGLNLMTLSNRKTALSRDMNRVAAEYNAAMNEKVLKWSSDSGVTYRDLNYDLLMKPNDVNSTLPYIITDDQGRVVIDDSTIPLENGNSKVTYRDLAMMISAYSGDDGNGNAQYNNLNNLTGGNLTSAAIGGATLTGNDKAVSGVANKDKEYEIVTNSVDMVSGTLRYELMEKLGLITKAEKNAVINKEQEIYGTTEKTTGPYPVDCLMGKYYLAMAHYEAYRNFLEDGDYEYSSGSDSKTGKAAQNGPITSRQHDSFDGTGSITYTNSFNKNNSNVKFDGVSSYVSNLQLDGVNQAEQIITTSQESNFSYSISNGKIHYNYEANNLLSMMGNTNLEMGAYKDNRYTHKDSVKDMSWQELINGNYAISLHWQINDTNCERNDYEGKVRRFISAMADGVKTAGANLTIDETALDKASQSTQAFFLGDITNNGNIASERGPNTDEKKSIDNSVKQADQNNLVGEGWKIFHWFILNPSRASHQTTINAKNVYNTLITFYQYYLHSPDANVILDATGGTFDTSGPDSQIGGGSADKITTTGVTYDSGQDKYFQVGSQWYVRKQSTGEYTDPDSGNKSTLTLYHYYKTSGNGGAAIGEPVQEDQLSSSENTIIRIVKNADNTYSTYEHSKTGYNNETIGSNGWTPSSNGSSGSLSGAKLILKYKDDNGNDVEMILANKVSDSVYATTISATPADGAEKLKELEDIANQEKSNLDEALAELDQLFASKDSKIMDYFDAIFKMISQNGWVYDEHVNDITQPEESKNYLNAKLENNMYFITEVDTLDGTDFNYATKLATNVSKVFQVFDRDAQNVALSEYEAEKAEITAKEKQVDVRMNKLEMEQDAIKTELDSLKKIINDNIDNTFKIFT